MPLSLEKTISFFVLLMLCQGVSYSQTDTLGQLSETFWSWRAQEQPFSEDDIPRLERPDNLTIDWSLAVVQKRRKQLSEFERRWKELVPGSNTAINQQVDYRLVGSAIARVHWELDIEQGWKRNPEFYVDQTLGAMQILLLPPAPFSEDRQRQIIRRVESFPATIRAAEANLSDMRQPFAGLAITALADVPQRNGAVAGGSEAAAQS